MKRLLLIVVLVFVFMSITAMYIDSDALRSSKLNSNDSSEFVIYSCKKESPTYVDSMHQRACNGWNLTEKDIEDILMDSEIIDADGVDNEIYTLQCYYKGRLSYKGNEYAYEVTSGSFSVMYNKDTSIYFAYFKDKNYFLAKPDSGRH